MNLADQEFGPRLAAKEYTMPAMPQIHEQLANAIIATVDHLPDSLCQIGFHAVPVKRSELPNAGFNKIGMIDGLEVAAEGDLYPSDWSRVVLGFDRELGTLVWYLNH